MSPRRYTDDDRLAVRGRHPIEVRIGRSLPLVRRGGLYKCCCPFHNEKSSSFTVYAKEGHAHCFGCGWHGDVVGWEMAYQHVTFVEAMTRLMDEAGLAADTPAARNAADDRRQYEKKLAAEQAAREADERQRAADLYATGITGAGTLMEAYFRSRGLTVPTNAFPVLRFIPSARYWVEDDAVAGGFRLIGFMPAIIAPFHHCATGALTGIQLTYLRADGGKLKYVFDPVTGEELRARKFRGNFAGSAIMLRRPGQVLGIAEGWETAASVFQASLGLPDAHPRRALPVWAAGSLDNMAGRGQGRGEPHPDNPGKHLPSAMPRT
jgi:CHC2 zinc finger